MQHATSTALNRRDMQAQLQRPNWRWPDSARPLVEPVNRKLMFGSMPAALKTEIGSAAVARARFRR